VGGLLIRERIALLKLRDKSESCGNTCNASGPLGVKHGMLT